MPTTQLSPTYGLAPTRLAGPNGRPWPALVLHSRHLVWAFDPQSRPLTGPADVITQAQRIGLWPVTDPFGYVPPAAEPWTFHLPTPARPARLDGPEGSVVIERAPHITGQWWNMAVTAGGRCRLLIAACVVFAAESPTLAADALIEAAAASRVAGATISVEF